MFLVQCGLDVRELLPHSVDLLDGLGHGLREVAVVPVGFETERASSSRRASASNRSHDAAGEELSLPPAASFVASRSSFSRSTRSPLAGARSGLLRQVEDWALGGGHGGLRVMSDPGLLMARQDLARPLQFHVDGRVPRLGGASARAAPSDPVSRGCHRILHLLVRERGREAPSGLAVAAFAFLIPVFTTSFADFTVASFERAVSTRSRTAKDFLTRAATEAAVPSSSELSSSAAGSVLRLLLQQI